jgi:gamma-glutamylcyclotransferase (GGCT)/AIG2-like uncharacterized protein YtfP
MNRLFVYGTLKPGEIRWGHILEPYANNVEAASAQGKLFDSGLGWPVAIFDDEGEPFSGVVVSIDPEQLDEAFAILDRIEGVADGLFQRITIDVDGQPCWTYHWPHGTPGFDRITQWPTAV